jgi:hypothetical protein
MTGKQRHHKESVSIVCTIEFLIVQSKIFNHGNKIVLPWLGLGRGGERCRILGMSASHVEVMIALEG